MRIFIKNFRSKKHFCRGQNIFFEVEIVRNFSKGKSMKIENFENLNFRFSLIFLWEIFDLKKIFLTSTKIFFRPENFDENPSFFYKSLQNLIWHK